jgi:hypothetical protein
MQQCAPLFALGRILLQPQPFPLGSELDDCVQRHVTGDWGRCGSHTNSKDSDPPNTRTLRYGGTVASLYRTRFGWLLIKTGPIQLSGKAHGDTETWCFLIDEFWECALDQMPRCSAQNPD